MRYAKLSIGVIMCDKHCPHFATIRGAESKELNICTKGNFFILDFERSGVKTIWPDNCPLEDKP